MHNFKLIYTFWFKNVITLTIIIGTKNCFWRIDFWHNHLLRHLKDKIILLSSSRKKQFWVNYVIYLFFKTIMCTKVKDVKILFLKMLWEFRWLAPKLKHCYTVVISLASSDQELLLLFNQLLYDSAKAPYYLLLLYK